MKFTINNWDLTQWIIKIKGKLTKKFFFNTLSRDNFLYIQIYDKDNNLIWNKKLEWLGHGFREFN